MTIYILDDNQVYNPNTQTKWIKVEGISTEDAIKLYTGKKTFQLHWEDENGMMCSITFPTFGDTITLAKHITNQIIAELKRKIIHV